MGRVLALVDERLPVVEALRVVTDAVARPLTHVPLADEGRAVARLAQRRDEGPLRGVDEGVERRHAVDVAVGAVRIEARSARRASSSRRGCRAGARGGDRVDVRGAVDHRAVGADGVAAWSSLSRKTMLGLRSGARRSWLHRAPPIVRRGTQPPGVESERHGRRPPVPHLRRPDDDPRRTSSAVRRGSSSSRRARACSATSPARSSRAASSTTAPALRCDACGTVVVPARDRQ